MVLRMVVSGGWAGLVRRHEVDMDALPPEEAEAIVRALSSLAARPAVVDGRMRDVELHAFSLDGGGRVVVQATSADPRALVLLAAVRGRSLPIVRQSSRL